MNNLNKELSGYFLSDARDFLKRFTLLSGLSTHIGNRSKLMIELLFAVECALKSVLFAESNTDGKESYDRIRKKSHHINKLYDALSPASKTAFDRSIKTDLTNFNVTTRYLLESQIVYRDECGALKEEYYQTIANPFWLDNLHSEITAFVTYADSLNPFQFTTINFADIDIEAEIKKHRQLATINQKP